MKNAALLPMDNSTGFQDNNYWYDSPGHSLEEIIQDGYFDGERLSQGSIIYVFTNEEKGLMKVTELEVSDTTDPVKTEILE